MSKRLSRPALLFVCVAGALVGCGPLTGPERPNVMVVVLDTTRADVLSVYGNSVPTTPRMDALAREGARFTRAYSTGFWTLPSHASLFTGQYPSAHGATSETNRLPSRAETLAEVLRRAGYRTAAFPSNPWVSAERGFDQGFETFTETWRQRPGLPHEDRGGVELVRRFLEGHDPGRPFFLFLNLNTAHMPYVPDEAVLRALHGDREPLVDPDRREKLAKLTGLWRHIAGREVLEDRDFAELRALYEAEIAMLDARVGELVDALRDRDLLDETLVVVTSDHGENIGEHGLIDHMLSMYDTTTRIPLILRYPPRIEAGRVFEGLTSLVDVAPTILDACGLPADALPAAGHSLMALLDGTIAPPPFVVAENERPVNGVELLNRAFPDFDTTQIDRPMRMLRTSRHKLIRRDGAGVELYDLENDPAEEEDVSDDLPELRERLLSDLEEWQAQYPQQPGGGGTATESADRESLEQLRALGYIE